MADSLPATLATTRTALQRVAVHVVARRRHDLVGRFGLRVTPGGFGTPAAGAEHDHEVVRVSGAWLIRERTGSAAATASLDLRTASLADAAELAGVDLAADFSAGTDTPPVGPLHEVLAVDPEAAAVIADWYALGGSVLDEVLARQDASASPSVVQLWPEHFDVGCDLSVGPDVRVNLGLSPGDGFVAEPYAYVGPRGPERPGDPAYWNAPFGAVLSWTDAKKSRTPPAGILDFLLTGLARLAPDPVG